MGSRRLQLLWILVVLVSWTLAGCGGGSDTVTVTGTTTLDGAPLDGAAVMMQPDGGGPAVTATTDASGGFTVQTVPGPHKVAVTKTKTTGDADGGMEVDGVLVSGNTESQQIDFLTPMQYASPMTSGLTVDVQNGMSPVTLDLKSKQ